MTVVAVKNQKGGVGKTTIASTLGVGLAARGYRVAMVDMDGQGHLSRAVGLPPGDGLYRVMMDDNSIEDVVQDVPSERYAPLGMQPGHLRLLSGDKKTPVIALHMQMQNWNFKMLGRKLAPLTEWADFTLIDTPPTVTFMEPATLAMTDLIIIPTLLESWSLDGVENVFETLINLELSVGVAGVLPIKVRHTNEHRDQLEVLVENFGSIVWAQQAIPLRTVFAEAADVGKSVMEYVPKDDAASYAWGAVDKFLEVVLNGS